MSSEDDSCTSGGSGSTATMELLQETGAGHPHSHATLSQVHPSLHHHQAYHHHLQTNALKVSSSSATTYKVKRTRQRVDAGEPRNSYASITNFSSQRFSANSFHPQQQQQQHQTSPTSNSSNAYHQFNGLSTLSSPPVNNKLLQHHLHSDSSTPKSSSAAGDSNNNSGVFKSNYSLTTTASAATPTTASDRDMILFDETVLQLCGSTATGGQMPVYVNGNNDNHLTELELIAKKSENNLSSPREQKEKTNSTSPRSNDSSAHLLRDILQTGRNAGDHKTGAHCDQSQQHSPRSSDAKGGGNVSHCSDASDGEEEDLNEEDTSRDGSEQDEQSMSHVDKQANVDKLAVAGHSPSASRSSSPFADAASVTNNHHSNGHSTGNNSTTSNGNSNISEVKRARVETIVSNMLLGGSSTGSLGIANGSSEGSARNETVPVNGCKKRKLYQPQQSKLNSEEDDDEDEEEEDITRINEDEDIADEEDFPDEIADLSAKKAKTDEKNSEGKDSLRQQLQTLQAQLFTMKHQYVQLFEQQRQHERFQRESLQSLTNRPLFQSPVNLSTSVNPEEEDVDENLSDKGGSQTPISQLSDHRETPANSSSLNNSMANASSIQDPAQFLDEARRILSEQERLACKRNRLLQPVSGMGTTDIECLCDTLKAEIQSNIFPTILQMIDSTVSRFFQRRGDQPKTSPNADASKDLTILSQMLESKSPRTGGKVSDRGPNLLNQKSMNGPTRASPFTLPTESAPAPKPSGPSPFAFPPSNFKSPFFLPNIGHGGSQPPQAGLIPPTFAHHFNTIASALSQQNRDATSSTKESVSTKTNGSHSSSKDIPTNREVPVPEQTEAMSLVVAPKRKRHKVTDTRITPRTVSRILGQEPLLSGITGPGSPPNNVFSHHGPSAPPPPLVPVSLPTSVAIPNPSLHQTELFGNPAFAFADPAARFGFYGPPLALDYQNDGEQEKDNKNNAVAAAAALSSAVAAHHLSMLAAANRGSPDSLHGYQASGVRTGMGSDSGNNDGSEVSFNESSQYDGTMPMISFSHKCSYNEQTNTLTPMHLRKAKLMFFYVRYPSSAILKMYFPDIKFNKNNTAQLVKWFSNFREFYYIQMEKYARQAMSEGVKSPDEINVSNDSELIRVLNLHYNRNNHIEVPQHFRFVVEQTLREFFKAVSANKDQEQSWKKAIYKVIARLDDNVPEYFKSPNFLEQLE